MATSYSNPGGVGDRRNVIFVTATGSFAGNPNRLVEGSSGVSGDFWFSGGGAANTRTIVFDFYDTYIVDEATLYQTNADSHGTWQWQGSNDGSSWTNIGAGFTLGGAAVQTQTSLSGNTTAYRYYRIQGVSGTVSTGPFLTEFEFKIDERTGGNTTAYIYSQGSGDRSSTIVITATVTTAGIGGLPALVNGVFDQIVFFQPDAQAAAGKYLRFDFGAARKIDEAVWTQSNALTHGVWKWQGSNNAVAWTDIGSSFTLGGGTETNTPTAPQYRSYQRELRGNATAYRYYQLLGVSGSTTNGANLEEIQFRIDSGPVSASWNADGAGTCTWEGTRAAGTWTADGHGTCDWQVLLRRYIWSADGQGTCQWGKAGQRVWNADGQGSCTWFFREDVDLAWNADGSGSCEWVITRGTGLECVIDGDGNLILTAIGNVAF